MPYWKPLVSGGQIVDLSHLEPFDFTIVPLGWTDHATVHVTFNNHCFTCKFDPVRHAEALSERHTARYERRAFDEIRYTLSKTLPLHIRALDGQRISRTRTNVLVRIAMERPMTERLRCRLRFFSLQRAGPRQCDLFVMSAYPLARGRHTVAVTGEMRFNLAVARVLEGKTLKFLPSRR